MKVVSNASPLVNLSRIGRISILKDLYGQIIIPEAVHREVVVEGRGMPGAVEVSEAEWIVTENVSNFQHVHVLRYDLDAGGGKNNLLISFTPTPALPQREREHQSFRTGTNYVLNLANEKQ